MKTHLPLSIALVSASSIASFAATSNDVVAFSPYDQQLTTYGMPVKELYIEKSQLPFEIYGVFDSKDAASTSHEYITITAADTNPATGCTIVAYSEDDVESPYVLIGTDASGTYEFTATSNMPAADAPHTGSIRITVVDSLDLTWYYDGGDGNTPIADTSDFTVEWNGLAAYTLMATLPNGQQINASSTYNCEPLSSLRMYGNGLEGWNYNSNSESGTGTYLIEPKLVSANSVPENLYLGKAPDLNLTITTLTPAIQPADNNFQFSSSGISFTFNSYGLSRGSAPDYNITAKVVKGDFTPVSGDEATIEATDGDGLYDESKLSATLSGGPSATAAFGPSVKPITLKFTVPCSGLYNIVVSYNNTDWKDLVVSEVTVPVIVYPSLEGVAMGSVNEETSTWVDPANRIAVTEAEGGGYEWIYPQGSDDFNPLERVNIIVQPALTTIYYGLGSKYDFEEPPTISSTATSTDSTTKSSPRKAAETEGEWNVFYKPINLTDQDAVSIALAKNGAVNPTPMYVMLKQGDDIITGIDPITDLTVADQATAPEFYTLSGVRLPAPPASGIYIEKRGASVTKHLR